MPFYQHPVLTPSQFFLSEHRLLSPPALAIERSVSQATAAYSIYRIHTMLLTMNPAPTPHRLYATRRSVGSRCNQLLRHL